LGGNEQGPTKDSSFIMTTLNGTESKFGPKPGPTGIKKKGIGTSLASLKRTGRMQGRCKFCVFTYQKEAGCMKGERAKIVPRLFSRVGINRKAIASETN